MSVTRKIATYGVAGQIADLPEPVVKQTRLAVLNTLAAAIGGTQSRTGKMHVALAKTMGGGSSDATLYGDGGHASLPAAVYGNASLAFALDYEDVTGYCIHAGPVTIPAALAVAETLDKSGADVIIAIERGYEVGARIGKSQQPTAARGSQVWGQQYTPFAPCIAACHLMGFTPEQADSAMGVAGAYAPVPSAYKYFGIVNETRPIREVKLAWGWMSLGGVMAALSVQQGFGGGFGVLDGDEGFWIMAGSDRCDHDSIVADLGSTHNILDTDFKVHPSIAWSHPPHVALKRMMREHGFTADDVEHVLVRGLGAIRTDDFDPAGEVDAMFSMPYAVATTLLGDPLDAKMYAEERIKSPEVAAMLKRITIEPDEEADMEWFNGNKMGHHVAVTLKNGTVHRTDIQFPKDKPDIGWPDIEAKFRHLADGVLSPANTDAVVNMVGELEQQKSIKPLLQAMQSF